MKGKQQMKYGLLIASLIVFTLGCERAKPPVEAQPVSTTPTEPAPQLEEKKTEYTPPLSAPSDFLKDDDPVFHGLKLGVALKDQLPKCQVGGEGAQAFILGDGFCYLASSFDVDKGTGSAFVEIRRGGQIAVEPNACEAGKCTYREDILVHVLPAKSRESGAVESVNSSYPPEQFDNIRHKLEADYGSPVDNNGWIHYSTPWGRVNLSNWTYQVSVEAESARMARIVALAVRKALGKTP